MAEVVARGLLVHGFVIETSTLGQRAIVVSNDLRLLLSGRC
jgi:hypothetical protein